MTRVPKNGGGLETVCLRVSWKNKIQSDKRRPPEGV